jgi:hypothetical protein
MRLRCAQRCVSRRAGPSRRNECDQRAPLIEATTGGTHTNQACYLTNSTALAIASDRRCRRRADAAGRNLTGNERECRMKTNEACSNSSATEIAGYSYDGAGNETKITGYSEPESSSFTYNNLNQLQAITPPGSSEQSLSHLRSGQADLTAVGPSSLQNSTLGASPASQRLGDELIRTDAWWADGRRAVTRRRKLQPHLRRPGRRGRTPQRHRGTPSNRPLWAIWRGREHHGSLLYPGHRYLPVPRRIPASRWQFGARQHTQ